MNLYINKKKSYRYILHSVYILLLIFFLILFLISYQNLNNKIKKNFFFILFLIKLRK